MSDEARLQGWALTLPPSGAFTHLSAARVLGLWTPPGTAGLPVTVAVGDREWRPRRPGMRAFRLTEVPRAPDVAGLPVTTPAEVVLACARHLAFVDLVVLVDSALHHGVCSYDDLLGKAASRRRGARALRGALACSEPLSESPGETLLRMIHVLGDVPVVAQHPVRDDAGVLLARADLWIRRTRRLPEYDGGHHREPAQYERDRRRDRQLISARWEPYSYSIRGVLRRGAGILRDADDALGRPHDAARGRSWSQALAESCWSPVGVAKLRARLQQPHL